MLKQLGPEGFHFLMMALCVGWVEHSKFRLFSSLLSFNFMLTSLTSPCKVSISQGYVGGSVPLWFMLYTYPPVNLGSVESLSSPLYLTYLLELPIKSLTSWWSTDCLKQDHSLRLVELLALPLCLSLRSSAPNQVSPADHQPQSCWSSQSALVELPHW